MLLRVYRQCVHELQSEDISHVRSFGALGSRGIETKIIGEVTAEAQTLDADVGVRLLVPEPISEVRVFVLKKEEGEEEEWDAVEAYFAQLYRPLAGRLVETGEADSAGYQGRENGGSHKRWWLHKVGRVEDPLCGLCEEGVAQNAVHLLSCPGIADGIGREWEQIWEDPEWCEKLAEAVRG
ncbi:hypothetical protein EV426DRAFT_708977 [Tirmania nivea]|nr:hypothetical protein EV426DRAFT_708977 [Tirmania nivea]